MPNLSKAVRDLQKQRDDLQAQLSVLDTAISALDRLSGTASGRKGGRRKMSADARERIAAAQRALWAKWKKSRKS